ncbi:NAD-dependent deacetylase [Pseudomonas duriflava]|uniref:protein acetyllysine N-acetyltransferase n=1 Tax=Pseudomonas duriflava TaxID=459528 RepID=A0A562QAM9_9PSED|nr:NAD-dependent protein deacylase [Pseudomonas duriflava]TWI53769.1 NAD-dependent deacetylase [Pseudomonas duriflava]
MDARQVVARELSRAQRILIITGAGLSADSGLPTYRGLNGLYNGLTEEGIPIESALSGPMLRKRPEVCWKYLAELARGCLNAEPNDGHYAIAALQQRKSECWVLTQNIDGFHRRSGSPVDRLIEIHGDLAPVYCSVCGYGDVSFSRVLAYPLPPRCDRCGGILRPSVVLFEEALPAEALARLVQQINLGFDAIVLVGTTASFPYIVEPVLHTLQSGGFVAEINPAMTDLSAAVTIRLQERAVDVLPIVLSHICD